MLQIRVLLTTKYGDEVAVGVVERGRDREASRAGAGTEGFGEGCWFELGVCREEIGDDVVVLDVAERASRVHEQTVWADVARVAREDFALALGGGGDVGLSRGPLELRETTPGASAAAWRINQHTVVERVRGGRVLANGDLRKACTIGAEL